MPETGKIEKLEPDFDKSGGLVPAVAQCAETGQILMLAYMNREAYEMTLSTGQVHYWSRSRKELWHKGGGSGHVQLVKELFLDCDQDAIVVKIEQVGGVACHTGKRSCFHFKRVSGDDYEVLEN
ncbi:MAG: phosphoribosyl-AMP cyclohydrolase [Deltaproteobacteria bacterium]|jgi:phosphoribosyl-AMP cyclohydrolase|nr:phosphoribosyl-AMP cyclohydrolase [Deltaproteobacteria bacterium]